MSMGRALPPVLECGPLRLGISVRLALMDRYSTWLDVNQTASLEDVLGLGWLTLAVICCQENNTFSSSIGLGRKQKNLSSSKLVQFNSV